MGNDKKGWDDSLISLGLGALVVVVSGILLYNFFSSTSKDLLSDLTNSNRGQTSSTQIEEAAAPTVEPTTVPGVVTPLPEETIVPATPALTALAKATATAVPTQIAKATATAAPTLVAKASATVAPTLVAQATPITAPTQIAKATNSPAPSTVAAATTTSPVTTTTEGTLKDSYTVVRGDSLWKIAEKFYGTGYDWKAIQKANKLEGKALLAGMTLEVPRQGMTSSSSTVAASTTPVQAGDGSTVSAPSSTPAIGGANASGINYTVVKGDSLSVIAYKQCGNQFLWTQLAEDNKLSNPRVIEVGQLIQVTCKR